MGRVVGWCLLALLLAPALALGPALLIDRGPSGEPRVSAFPAALVVLDPAVWRALRNSGVAAGGITLGSMVGGLILGTILARRRFWGRRLLGALLLVPLAVGPMGLTLGVRFALGDDSTWEWLAARWFLGQPGDDWGRWFVLVVSGVIGGIPVVMLATRASWERVDPAWSDAARVVGAGRFWVWRDVAWPTVRPSLAGAGSLVFAWSLVEPGGPIVLGLRRTLAGALVEASQRGDANRLATLAGLALILGAMVRVALRRWGRSGRAPEPVGLPELPPRAGALGGLVLVVVGAAWALVTLGPVVVLARRLVDDALGENGWNWASARRIAVLWADPDLAAWVVNSAVTATLAVTLNALILLVLGPSGATLGARWGRRLAVMPPLTLAAGALVVPGLVAALAGAASPLGGEIGAALEWIRRELSPARSPGWLLILVLAATRWPLLARAGALGRRRVDPALVEAALVLGAEARSARRLAAQSGRSGSLVAPLAVAWAWSATDLAAAWLLTSLPERRTLAPAALDLLLAPGGDPLHAARLVNLAVALLVVRLVALVVLVRSGPKGRAVDWPILP